MYLNENELQKAAHCVETIILHNPNDHLWLQRYADIKYTQGGYDNYEMARIYYLSSLKVCKKNLRALYGLNLVIFIENQFSSTVINVNFEIIHVIFEGL